jgi:choline kinase
MGDNGMLPVANAAVAIGGSAGSDAIILAAGIGKRLGSGRPKCLTMIGGRLLIDHQLDALAAAGVTSPVVVVGFGREHVCAAVGDRARIVVNDRYATTNSIYSFLLAREHVRGAAFIVNADVLFDPRVVLWLARRRGSALACDSSSGQDAEQMKVAMRQGRLLSMSKSLDASLCGGENLGVLRLDRTAVLRAFEAADDLVARGQDGAWVAAAINAVARHQRIECVDVAGTPWIEIDYPEDLEHARRSVWPAIATHPGRRRMAPCWRFPLLATEEARL